MMKNSLAKEKEIVAILRKKPLFSRNMMIRCSVNSKNTDYRYTIVASKKVFKQATKRNRIKRRIRSVIISLRKQINKKMDFVVVPKAIVLDLPYRELKEELSTLLVRAKIVTQ